MCLIKFELTYIFDKKLYLSLYLTKYCIVIDKTLLSRIYHIHILEKLFAISIHYVTSIFSKDSELDI